jgi:5-(carboxyamino)imidazole ribonucleotide synthase
MVKRVGVIGGGQLAWMMAGAAKALGVELIVQTPQVSDPAVSVAADVVLAAIDDAQATAALAERCDVITFENEFVNLEALSALAQQGVQFYPQLETLAPLLDKYQQRRYLQSIGLPVPRFASVAALSSDALTQFGLPLVLKARRHGYDGQGTFVLHSTADLAALPQRQSPLLVEAFVPFERELAIMVARSIDGEIVTYPVVETVQVDQVCRRVYATQSLAAQVTQTVESIAYTLMDCLQTVGIFGIELFLTQNQQVLVNEVAPRTHNSGHLTLDACATSQFEQQLRAVCGLPLGSPAMRCDAAVMVNLLGYERAQADDADYIKKRQQLAQIPQAQVYWYGKPEARSGRKLGHVTVPITTATPAARDATARQLADQIESLWYPQST